MIVLVGLGNPGEKFAGTRHNVGFIVLDRLADKWDLTWAKEDKFKALVARADEKGVLLAKPLTFMNLSGEAVSALVRFYKIKPADVWLIYDDVDLPVGTARIKGKGSGESTHKGVQAVVAALGTAAFPRWRLGIAHAKSNISAADRPQQQADLKDFVLSRFDKREQPLVEKAMVWVVQEISTSLKKKDVTARTLTKGI